ncbi:MAG: hypothetical protein WBN29_11315, partial [Polyangiales bacterium]
TGGVPGTEFAEDFESLDPTNAMALSQDGWVGFANIWQPDGTTYIRGYSPGAWDGTSGFSNVAEGQGGASQGNRQIAVFSDYNNQPDQTAGNRVEANTFRERDIVADDAGKTMTFSFDAKRGSINDPADSGCTGTTNPPCDSSALAFIKTLDPGNGFATTNFETEDTTAIPETWMRYEISLAIDAGLVGQKIQFGFSATASNNEPSGVFYDNVLVVTATP